MAGDAVIVAGFGFRGAATRDSLADALARADGQNRTTHLATAEDKASTDSFQALARSLGLPVIAIDAGTLARQETQTCSAASLAARDTGSVAEAAALAAAGPGARLLAPRVTSGDGMATCAMARARPAEVSTPEPIRQAAKQAVRAELRFHETRKRSRGGRS